MPSRRRPRPKQSQTNDPNAAQAQLELRLPCLASSSQADAPPPSTPSNPPGDPQPTQEYHRRQPPALDPGSTPGDSPPLAAPRDHAPAPPGKVIEPVMEESARILFTPSTSREQDAHVLLPPRRFTLDALLRAANTLEALRRKAAAWRGSADETAECARGKSSRIGDDGRQDSGDIPRSRSGTNRPDPRQDGSPALPLVQGERKE